MDKGQPILFRFRFGASVRMETSLEKRAEVVTPNRLFAQVAVSIFPFRWKVTESESPSRANAKGQWENGRKSKSRCVRPGPHFMGYDSPNRKTEPRFGPFRVIKTSFVTIHARASPGCAKSRGTGRRVVVREWVKGRRGAHLPGMDREMTAHLFPWMACATRIARSSSSVNGPRLTMGLSWLHHLRRGRRGGGLEPED